MKCQRCQNQVPPGGERVTLDGAIYCSRYCRREGELDRHPDSSVPVNIGQRFWTD